MNERCLHSEKGSPFYKGEYFYGMVQVTVCWPPFCPAFLRKQDCHFLEVDVTGVEVGLGLF